MVSKLSSVISHLGAAALGSKKADLVLINCNIQSVYTKEQLPKSQIAIIKDRIAYVGPDASHTVGPYTVTLDMKNKYITPGFADPHTHIDQFVLPSELAQKSLLCGVTSLFSDPIDIVCVAGKRGFDAFLQLCRNTPIRIFNVVPGGLPVDPKFSGPVNLLTTTQLKHAIKNSDDIVGLGEVFSWTKVTSQHPQTMKNLSATLDADCIINGHTAGASAKKLNAYIASGILSCHEPINYDQVLDRLRLGMWIMIREGSIRRDLQEIIPRILDSKPYTNRIMFCSDGLDPQDLLRHGHINHCVAKSVKLGMDPIDAITMATRNCFDYYNMGKDLGGIAPGKLADILVFDNLKQFKPTMVFVGGKLVVRHGRIITNHTSPKKGMTKSLTAAAATTAATATATAKIPKNLLRTVHLKRFSAKDFIIKDTRDIVPVNTVHLSTEIITRLGTAELSTQDGNILPCASKDVYKVAAFNRLSTDAAATATTTTTTTTKKTKNNSSNKNQGTIGFLSGFGAPGIGAFASTWNFHENNLIVIGSNENDMALAANNLIDTQGGITVVAKGKTLACLPLQLGGIVSTDPFDTVAKNFAKINRCIIQTGRCSKFKKPHLIPLFLPFLALPAIRILSTGIVDVKKQSIIQPVIAR